MNSDISIDPKQIFGSFSTFIHRYHVMIFACIVLGGLSAATFFLYQTAISAQSVAPGPSRTVFDQKTIMKIKDLRSSKEPENTLSLPAGRTNPFEEGS